ncbi:deaminase [Mucilaginibacter sp. PAMC 26640]|nr:deaminase [Mucilaginibacter sp. PAMC 26640]
MRKIKLQMQVSLDGYVAGPNGEMDWMTWDWDEELVKYVGSITETVDLIILGRVLAEGFIPVWQERIDAGDTEPFSQQMVSIPKVVFSKTLTHNLWANTTLATGDIIEEITQLKNLPGGDMMVYGGAGLASAMIKNKLIDEYYIFVNPVVIGKGMTIYNDLKEKLSLELIAARSFSCGINVLAYRPAK